VEDFDTMKLTLLHGWCQQSSLGNKDPRLIDYICFLYSCTGAATEAK